MPRKEWTTPSYLGLSTGCATPMHIPLCIGLTTPVHQLIRFSCVRVLWLESHIWCFFCVNVCVIEYHRQRSVIAQKRWGLGGGLPYFVSLKSRTRSASQRLLHVLRVVDSCLFDAVCRVDHFCIYSTCYKCLRSYLNHLLLHYQHWVLQALACLVY